MEEILTKQKSWTDEIVELSPMESLFLPIENERSIRAMLLNKHKGRLRDRFPDRKYKTKTVVKVHPTDLNEYKVLQVTRVK